MNDKIGQLFFSPIIKCFSFVDVEETKEVKRMMHLLAITVNLYHEIDADPSGSGSNRSGQEVADVNEIYIRLTDVTASLGCSHGS